MEKITFREATKDDVPHLIALVKRLKQLNEEFDPLFVVRDDIEEQARKYLENAVENDDRFVLLCEMNGRIVGLLKAQLKERQFYEPRKEGAIVEFYLLPSVRHEGLGKKMLEEAEKRLKDKGVQLITAEFPTNNKIAIEFYKSQNYHPVLNVYGKKLD